MNELENYNTLQVCVVAIYGKLKRFWKLHWKVITISVAIGIVAGIIVAKVIQGRRKPYKHGKRLAKKAQKGLR